MRRLLLSAFLTVTAAYSEPLPSFAKSRLLSPFQIANDGSAPAPMLLDITKGQGNLTRSEGRYLPNRVYGIYHKAAKAWVYTLTTFHGELPKPLELLYKGTVAPGNYIGAANPLQRYKLSNNYLWVPTDERETYLTMIPERPGEVKRVTYLQPPAHRDLYDETIKK